MDRRLELYKILFDQASEGLVLSDERGLIEMVNSSALKLFGYSSVDELTGQRIDTLIPHRFHRQHGKDHAGYMKKPHNRKMGGGQVLHGARKDGTEFPVEIGLSTFLDEHGNRKAVAMVSDITERIRIRDELKSLNEKLEQQVEIRSLELRKSNLLYKSIARNFPKGSIYVFNRKFDYVFADGQELRNRGISGDDLVGINYRKLLDQSISEQVIPKLKEVFSGKEKRFEINYHNAVFSIYAVPLTEQSHEKIDHILVVERDVTSEKEAEREIKTSLDRERELNSLKSRFVTIVSHEFRTPLSAIKSSAQLIEKYTSAESNHQRLKHTQRIQNSVNHLNGMIEDILSLSKIEEGKVELKQEKINIDEIVSEITEEYAELFPGPKMKWNPGRHEIVSDMKLVRHILQNIIANAFKYTPDGKEILVKINSREKCCIVLVKDQGVGIPESEQAKLFERFYRATNVANIKGTGLGLHIVKKYLEMLGGSIKFNSKVNRGSEFWINLPENQKL